MSEGARCSSTLINLVAEPGTARPRDTEVTGRAVPSFVRCGSYSVDQGIPLISGWRKPSGVTAAFATALARRTPGRPQLHWEIGYRRELGNAIGDFSSPIPSTQLFT